MKGSELWLPHDVVCKNLIFASEKLLWRAMGEAIIGRLCNYFLLISISFSLWSTGTYGLSVDYSKHHCNHEHPKAHEASGIVLLSCEILQFFFGVFFVWLLRKFNHTWIWIAEAKRSIRAALHIESCEAKKDKTWNNIWPKTDNWLWHNMGWWYPN